MVYFAYPNRIEAFRSGAAWGTPCTFNFNRITKQRRRGLVNCKEQSSGLPPIVCLIDLVFYLSSTIVVYLLINTYRY